MLVVVGSERIRRDDLLGEWERRRAKGRPVESKEALLEEMIERRQMIAYAKSKGLESPFPLHDGRSRVCNWPPSGRFAARL